MHQCMAGSTRPISLFLFCTNTKGWGMGTVLLTVASRARCYSTLKRMRLHLEDKNRLPASTPAGSSILMTEIYYSNKPNLRTCVLMYVHVFACLGATG